VLRPRPVVDEDPSADDLERLSAGEHPCGMDQRQVEAGPESSVTLQAAGGPHSWRRPAPHSASVRMPACSAKKPNATMAPDMAARRSRRWRYIDMRCVPVGSVCYVSYFVDLLADLEGRLAADGRRR